MSKIIVWSIAGSDTSGGAGLQADLKTFQALDAHGCVVVTAVTSQSTASVDAIEPITAVHIGKQISSLKSDLPAHSIKIGMVFSAQIAQSIVEHLQNFIGGPIVWDPVLSSTSGTNLVAEADIEEIKRSMFSISEIVTPNIPEACLLAGIAPVDSRNHDRAELNDLVEEIGRKLLSQGARAVLIKGGHAGGTYSQDYFTDGHQKWWLTSRRIAAAVQHRGTGCTLSSAYAVGRARGYSQLDSLVYAKGFINQCLRQAYPSGSGSLLLNYQSFKISEEYLPCMTPQAVSEELERKAFLRHDNIGFYPIVNRAEMVDKLVKAGAPTVQIRIKDLHGEELATEIRHAINLTRASNTKLYVNDHWELALEMGAFGVHLGQEDLVTANIELLHKRGVRLGVSTHCLSEVARALAIQPSYVAIGPIFTTTTKEMSFQPQGLAGFHLWRQALTAPLVAIGGIFLENAPDLLSLGANGIAVVRDVTQTQDIAARVKKWLELFHSRSAL